MENLIKSVCLESEKSEYNTRKFVKVAVWQTKNNFNGYEKKSERTVKFAGNNPACAYDIFQILYIDSGKKH